MAKNNILPVFIPHGGCRHRCVFCNQREITGVDCLPAAEALNDMLPKDCAPDAELAYYGGSFTALPSDIRSVYLEFAAKAKREGKVGKIRLSTHPAYINEEILGELLSYGVDCVELGIQSTSEAVLSAAGRGHGRAEIFRAAELLQAAPLQWGVQLMVGLPQDDAEKDILSVLELLPYAPDMARIYPVLVLDHTELANMWRRGEYTPLTVEEAVRISARMFALFQYAHVSVIRMGLQPTEEISADSDILLAGPFHSAFGHLVRCCLKKEQMKMLMRGHEGEALCFSAPKRELPLLFGDGGTTLASLGAKLRAGDAELPAGSVAIAPYDDKKHPFGILSERDFLEKYTLADRRKTCI